MTPHLKKICEELAEKYETPFNEPLNENDIVYAFTAGFTAAVE